MFIFNLLIILVAAGLGRVIAAKIKQPAILGELVFGMILGSIGIVTLTDSLNHLADIGIIILLFSAGLALDFQEFKRLGKPSVVVAFSGVILPFILGYVAAILFGFSQIIALFIGTALVATSVGVNTEVLSELKMLKSRIGTLIMGAAIADDVIGIILLGIVTGIAATGSIIIGKTIFVVLSAILFFLLTLTLGVKIFKKVLSHVTVKPENLLLLGLVIAFSFALFTESIGLALIIGAFVGGLLLGQTYIARSLWEKTTLIGESFFIPIFFVTIGMQFDIRTFTSIGFFAVVLIILAILGKLIGCGFGAKLCGFSQKESLAVGVAMIPRAGVELILLKLGMHYGIISTSLASAILMMVIVTTLITPPLLTKALKNITQKYERCI